MAAVVAPIAKRFAHMASNSADMDRRNAEYELRQEEEKQRARESAWKAFIRERGIRYEPCTLENYRAATEPQRAAVTSLRKYSDDLALSVRAGTSIVLIGPPGTGKDHLLIPLARQAILSGMSLEWANGQDIFAAFREAIKDERSELEVVRKYANAHVLLLSDPIPPVGALKDFQSSMLFQIIDRRYRNCRPTWVTMNAANSAEAREKIGAQVVDRLAHDALVIPCNWESYRKPGVKA